MFKDVILLGSALVIGFGSIKLFFVLFFSPDSVVFERQKKLSTKVLNELIIAHESKRLVCSQILVGSVYKQVLTFDKEEIIADSNPNFLGAWMGIPVFYSPAVYDGDAIALADNPGFPSTTTGELPL
jgi:hypothetical protein